ncbi:hypothetical protein Y032_0776g2263 [Ancylostoma ceylanicum]|uniref:Uncharacterized protein n=1 Tax=Ancylostoma ceylanicum TaxID=53326 RepID=A0A016WDC0_9BILA|nr:hypothetical protein Y032_0776g2263 [Ancylostoma ceylanicum]
MEVDEAHEVDEAADALFDVVKREDLFVSRFAASKHCMFFAQPSIDGTPSDKGIQCRKLVEIKLSTENLRKPRRKIELLTNKPNVLCMQHSSDCLTIALPKSFNTPTSTLECWY